MSDIKLTEETRVALYAYMQRKQQLKEKRELKKLKGEPVKTSPDKFSTGAYVSGTYSNRFQKHIRKLEQLKTQLQNRLSTGGYVIEIGDHNQKKLDTAAKYVAEAIEALDSLKEFR